MDSARNTEESWEDNAVEILERSVRYLENLGVKEKQSTRRVEGRRLWVEKRRK